MKKRILAVLCALTLLLTMAMTMSSCKETGDNSTDANIPAGDATTYTVTLKTKGGMVLSDMDVYVYADDTLKDMQGAAKTNDKGVATFNLPATDKYAVTVAGAPKGYVVEKSYAFKGNKADIVLDSALVQGEDMAGASFALGSVMYDVTVTDTAGTKHTLSEILKKKKMVALNFWYTTCSWCVQEFPVMSEAYKEFEDSVGVLAVDPLDEEGEILKFQKDMNLSFPMAKCPASWSTAFGIQGYPTTVVIDRYGVICLIESGALVEKSAWTTIFTHFTADDYEQILLTDGAASLTTNILPTEKMPTNDEIVKALHKGDFEAKYSNDTNEYSWSFVVAEKDGAACLKTTNKEIPGSFATLLMDVHLEKGQALGFDYFVSSEKASDILHVVVNDQPIYTISGVPADNKWTSCYAWVAEETGDYQLGLCYIKDTSTNEGEDTAYIRNMRIVDAAEVDTATYLPRQAAALQADNTYKYAEIVFNESDGYYHVGNANGPLLLAEIMNPSQFNEEKSVYDLIIDGDVTYNDKEIYNEAGMVDYCSFASNSSLGGVCTVNKELAEMLKAVAEQTGFEDNDKEWLKMCKYYQVYGTTTQLEDPIKGLAPFSAFTAKLGSDNSFTYNRIIMPRGMLAEFVPSKSGVYRITSHAESAQGVDGWIFNEKREEIYTHEPDERMFEDDKNLSMVYYMEAGTPYYIDIAFWDVYENGTIPYTIEYVGATYDLFRLCSPGYFTYDSDATGDAMYYTISGGIKAVLGDDGYYYHDLGDGKKGSKIYCDFSGLTAIFDTPIATATITGSDGKPTTVKGLIDKGAFDFSKNENDMQVLAYMAQNGNDPEKTDEYLQTLWGEDYDGYAEEYQLEDVYEGKFHGDGEDRTEEIKPYLSKMEKSPAERAGCVPVDEDLADLLQELMEKFTFENVDDSWLKLCYYYDYLGR
ncbi:MAG: redoxin domain-containing protein [Clostridia bacterium]|nr:redoxin domain-containing protein [Clostridia bacterium]